MMKVELENEERKKEFSLTSSKIMILRREHIKRGKAEIDKWNYYRRKEIKGLHKTID